MTTEKDSVTKVLASFVVILAVLGVALVAYSVLEHYRKTTDTSDKVYLVDFVGLVTTRIEVFGSEKILNHLKHAGAIVIPSSPQADRPWQDNQCNVTPSDAGWFPKFRMLCWEIGKTQPKKFESYNPSIIAKEAKNFHLSKVEAKKKLTK